MTDEGPMRPNWFAGGVPSEMAAPAKASICAATDKSAFEWCMLYMMVAEKMVLELRYLR